MVASEGLNLSEYPPTLPVRGAISGNCAITIMFQSTFPSRGATAGIGGLFAAKLSTRDYITALGS
jgi:hypothetical protein